MGFAPNYTPRYRARYLAAGIEHTILVRSSRSVSVSLAIDNGRSCLNAIFEDLKAYLADDFAWLSAEACDKDLDAFEPATAPVSVTGEVDWETELWSPIVRCTAMIMSGRAVGSRARLSMYGLRIFSDTTADIGANGLITAGEMTGLTAVVTTLNNQAHANNGESAIFYQRGTCKINDGLLKDVRRGIIG